MSKYRIVEKDGMFKIQRRFLLWWIDWWIDQSENFNPSLEETRATIRAWELEDSLKAKAGWREVK